MCLSEGRAEVCTLLSSGELPWGKCVLPSLLQVRTYEGQDEGRIAEQEGMRKNSWQSFLECVQGLRSAGILTCILNIQLNWNLIPSPKTLTSQWVRPLLPAAPA